MQKEALRNDKKDALKFPLKSQIQEILAVITAFSNLLLRETEALKKSDFKTVDTLQAEKRLFAKQYEAKVAALAARREELASIDLPLRERLMKERNRFNQILDDNMHALDLAQNSTKRLVNRILEAARHAVTEDRQTNYSKAGKTMSYKAASMSLSLDRNL